MCWLVNDFEFRNRDEFDDLQCQDLTGSGINGLITLYLNDFVGKLQRQGVSLDIRFDDLDVQLLIGLQR